MENINEGSLDEFTLQDWNGNNCQYHMKNK